MSSRRTFLRNLGVLGGAGMMMPILDRSLRASITEAMDRIRLADTNEAAHNDDYWAEIRKAFDHPRDYINLENGYYSMQPSIVLEDVLEDWRRINRLSSYYMRKQMDADREKIRKQLADFAGIPADTCALTRNTTESLDILISGLPLEAGDEVLISRFDYGSMREAFEQRARRFGIVVKTVDIPVVPESQEALVNAFTSAATERTKVLLCTHMINLNGQILPARELCAWGKQNGVHVIVDGAHSFAHLNLKTGELGCEYFGTSLHKWLCAPLGNGMLHVAKERIADIWPLMGDTGKAKDDIRKFEHQGTRPPASWLGIAHAIAFHERIGGEKKEARLRYLKSYWTEQVKDMPHIVMNTNLDPAHSCAIANVGVKGMDPNELADRLFKEHKVFTVAIKSGPLQGVRVTPHLYNNTEDLDALVRALESMK